MLTVRGLTKTFVNRYDAIAGGVRDATFTLPPGAFFTLLGPSGCGKTTTLRCIAGLERPDAGFVADGERVLFDAEQRLSVPMNHRRIGMVFQSYAIWPHMTVFENVAFPLRVAKAPRYSGDDLRRRVGKALASVDLAGYGGRPATRLSGGQQQRVALARAIVGEPRLLLLDEPLSNLDATLREEMRGELKRLQRSIGLTTVYVTHDQSEALAMSDMIAVMDRGRIVQLADPETIYFRPADTFVASFIGSTNILHGTAAEAAPPGGVGIIRLAGGALVQALMPDGIDAGRDTALSIRPEAITLAAGSGDTGGLMGHVVAATFLGAEVRYGVRVGESVLTIMARPQSRFAEGDAVALSFPPQAAVAVAPRSA